MAKSNLVIYTDGACAGNQYDHNTGGWGAIIGEAGDGRAIEIYGGEPRTTNNRMELTAVIRALETAAEMDPASIVVHSDSAYIVNCFHQKWYVRWRQNGWKNAKKQPVENQDLWEALLALAERLPVTFKKVKGHAGVDLNERADGLANRGIAEYPQGGSTRVDPD